MGSIRLIEHSFLISRWLRQAMPSLPTPYVPSGSRPPPHTSALEDSFGKSLQPKRRREPARELGPQVGRVAESESVFWVGKPQRAARAGMTKNARNPDLGPHRSPGKGKTKAPVGPDAEDDIAAAGLRLPRRIHQVCTDQSSAVNFAYQ